jgi:hypothetical protein
MMNPSNDIRELSSGELEAVTGAGDTRVGFNEQIAHFLSVHERTTVGDSFEWMPRPTKKK